MRDCQDVEKREVSQSDEAWRRRTAKLLSKIENSSNHNWFVSTLQLRVDSSMHIFIQLLRFSSDFTFTRKCKTAKEIGTPLEWHMRQFSFVYLSKTNNSFSSENLRLQQWNATYINNSLRCKWVHWQKRLASAPVPQTLPPAIVFKGFWWISDS